MQRRAISDSGFNYLWADAGYRRFLHPLPGPNCDGGGLSWRLTTFVKSFPRWRVLSTSYSRSPKLGFHTDEDSSLKPASSPFWWICSGPGASSARHSQALRRFRCWDILIAIRGSIIIAALFYMLKGPIFSANSCRFFIFQVVIRPTFDTSILSFGQQNILRKYGNIYTFIRH